MLTFSSLLLPNEESEVGNGHSSIAGVIFSYLHPQWRHKYLLSVAVLADSCRQWHFSYTSSSLALFLLISSLRQFSNLLFTKYCYYSAPDYAWTDEYGYGAAHVTSKIKMADGRLQVTEPGYYNIYSSITLKTRSELTANIHVKHSIKRINRQSIPHTDNILYKSVEMSRTSETFANSYVDGVVKLNANDELYVHVSNTSAIYKYPPSNFFGLYLVRSIW